MFSQSNPINPENKSCLNYIKEDKIFNSFFIHIIISSSYWDATMIGKTEITQSAGGSGSLPDRATDCSDSSTGYHKMEIMAV